MKLEMWVSVGFCPRLREYHVLIYILCRSCSQSVKVFTTFLYFDEDLMPDIYFWTLVDWGAVPKVYIFTNIRTLTRWKYVYIYIYIEPIYYFPPSWDIQTRHRKAGPSNNDSISELGISKINAWVCIHRLCLKIGMYEYAKNIYINTFFHSYTYLSSPSP